MQVKCLSSGTPVKKGNALLRSYLNAKSGTTYNVVPLLSSDLPPGERTGGGLDDRPRKGRNERERNNWRFCLSCFVRLSVYYRKSPEVS